MFYVGNESYSHYVPMGFARVLPEYEETLCGIFIEPDAVRVKYLSVPIGKNANGYTCSMRVTGGKSMA